MAWQGLFKEGLSGLGKAFGDLGATITGAKQQQDANLKLAQFQADANQKYLQQQLDYNSPKSQMRRYQDAGLNPNLIYSGGSSVSGGNQSAPLTYPDVRPADYQRLMNAVPLVNSTRLVNSQVQALDAKTRQTTVLTDLNRLQTQVLEKNPLLDSEGFKAIIDGLKSTASIKESQAGISEIQRTQASASTGLQVQKLYSEIQVLEQRFKLGQMDQQIKAQVLQSKEFQNAILEVQKKFMTDGDITPQHIYQFIQLLLMKML